MSLSIYFYSDSVTHIVNNNFYFQLTTPHLFNKKINHIEMSKNENHWVLIVVLPHYQAVITIDSLSYDNENIVQFAMQFLRTYATLHKIDFKEENWNFFIILVYKDRKVC